jgi:hypothetical protein
MGKSIRSRATTLARLNEAWLKLMREGRCEEAWCVSDQAQRLRKNMDCSGWPRHLQFVWNGASLAGERVLIRCYHGLGDTIQFARFIPEIARVAAGLSVWVQPVLIPLLSALPGIDRILPLHDGSPDVEYDVDIELTEVLHALRINVHSLTATAGPYLHVGSSRAARGSQPRVGLVWRAGDWDIRRSIPCALLATFSEIREVDWFILQRGPALVEWRHGFGSIPHIQNIEDEACFMGSLDLLITVDTLSAHLAGALGVPVWTLLPRSADWRWMEARSDTPWYPTMRLLRQCSAGTWVDVLTRVKRELLKLLQGR